MILVIGILVYLYIGSAARRRSDPNTPITNRPIHSKHRELSQLSQLSYPSVPGVYSEGVIPSSIPNLEVKPLSADNTAPLGCGKVGRRRAEVSSCSTANHLYFLLNTNFNI